MSEWPEGFAIANCIAWNETAKRHALSDATNDKIIVPTSATKRVYQDGRAHNVRLTPLEYRDQRYADADRHERNIAALSRRA